MQKNALRTVLARSHRIELRVFGAADAGTVRQLMNEPGWLRFIGDRQIRTKSDALRYLSTAGALEVTDIGPGFLGLVAVWERDANELVGLLSLLQRDYLDSPDLGFAFFAAHSGRGLAQEASALLIETLEGRSSLSKLHAITVPENTRSVALLERLGFQFRELVEAPAGNGAERLRRYERALIAGQGDRAGRRDAAQLRCAHQR